MSDPTIPGSPTTAPVGSGYQPGTHEDPNARTFTFSGLDTSSIPINAPVPDPAAIPPSSNPSEALDAWLAANGGSALISADRHNYQLYTISRVTQWVAEQHANDQPPFDLNSDAARQEIGFITALAVGAHDQEILQGLYAAQQGHLQNEPPAGPTIDGVDLSQVTWGDGAKLPTMDQLLAGNATQIMDGLLGGGSGSAALEAKRNELRLQDQQNAAAGLPNQHLLETFDQRCITAMITAREAGAVPSTTIDADDTPPPHFRNEMEEMAYYIGMCIQKEMKGVAKMAKGIQGDLKGQDPEQQNSAASQGTVVATTMLGASVATLGTVTSTLTHANEGFQGTWQEVARSKPA